MYSYKLLASVYGCGTYGGGTYNDANCRKQTDVNTENSITSNSLATTGESVIVGIVVGFVLIATALYLLFHRRRK